MKVLEFKRDFYTVMAGDRLLVVQELTNDYVVQDLAGNPLFVQKGDDDLYQEVRTRSSRIAEGKLVVGDISPASVIAPNVTQSFMIRHIVVAMRLTKQTWAAREGWVCDLPSLRIAAQLVWDHGRNMTSEDAMHVFRNSVLMDLTYTHEGEVYA